MKKFLFLALLSLSSNSFAHDFSSQLGDPKSCEANDISCTDYIYISCDNLTDKVHIEISGSKSVTAPIISAQIFKDSQAKNITTQGTSSVDFQGGGGAYKMTINKNKTGVVNYALVYHCEDANGEHTETDLNELQNQ
jgi:hypothetical protein